MRPLTVLICLLLASCGQEDSPIRPGNKVRIQVATVMVESWFGNPKWALQDIVVNPIPVATAPEQPKIEWQVTDVASLSPNPSLKLDGEKSDEGGAKSYPVIVGFRLVGDDRLLGQRLTFHLKSTLLKGSPGRIESSPLEGDYSFDVSTPEAIQLYEKAWPSRILMNPFIYLGLIALAAAGVFVVRQKKQQSAALETTTGPEVTSPDKTGQTAPAQSASAESWDMVFVSGLITGIVMAVSRANLDGLMWLLPTGLAYSLTITSGPFRFSSTQKIVATGITYSIGMYWPELLSWLLGGKML